MKLPLHRLEFWRRADLEALIWPGGTLPNNIAGDIDGLFREAQRQRTLKLPKP